MAIATLTPFLAAWDYKSLDTLTMPLTAAQVAALLRSDFDGFDRVATDLIMFGPDEGWFRDGVSIEWLRDTMYLNPSPTPKLRLGITTHHHASHIMEHGLPPHARLIPVPVDLSAPPSDSPHMPHRRL